MYLKLLNANNISIARLNDHITLDEFSEWYMHIET